MKLTWNWLKEYVELDGITVEQVAARLTMLGLEVDSVRPLAPVTVGVETALVEEVVPHPNADRLRLCRVRSSRGLLSVVCGAPNARAGLVTVLAPAGVVLPSGQEIRVAEVRGQRSEGMLCSARELGLGEDHGGIIELPPATGVGCDPLEVLGLRDTLLEVDLTPNRADCACVLGIAREVAGAFGRELRHPMGQVELPDLAGGEQAFPVRVETSVDCPRYAARLLRGVRIGPSPEWLRRRLEAVGQRSINNVVDITNLVMLEYGQPLHAFDAERLAGGCIVVRMPRAGEEVFVTLDGTERPLSPETLLICDEERPVALAGIMGGLASEVTDVTTTVLLESACFNPVGIRRTGRRLKLHTEASYRFERGVDPAGTVRALERAARLMVDLAGAELVAGGADSFSGTAEPRVISLRLARVRDLLGMALPLERVASLLGGIGMTVTPAGEDVLRVVVPSFRVDIDREIDLVEEVARLAGYDEIPVTMPKMAMEIPRRHRGRELRQQCAALMQAMGFHEAINYSFVAEGHAGLCPWAGSGVAPVRLRNPLAEEQAVMRTALLPSLLDNVRHNIHRGHSGLRLVETGKVFLPDPAEPLPEERMHLCAVMTGPRVAGGALFHGVADPVDIYDIKGVTEALLGALRLLAPLGPVLCATSAGGGPDCADGAQVLRLTANSSVAGWLGRVNDDMLRRFDIKQDVYFLELDLDLLRQFEAGDCSFRQLPRFPATRRDIALVVGEEIPAGDLLEHIRQSGQQLLERVDIFDVYRGEQVAAGAKSVALALIYRAADRTLDDETVDRVHADIVQSLIVRFGGHCR